MTMAAKDSLETGIRTSGYDLVFIESPPSDYECPICQLVMKQPRIVDCCGYKYCHPCIDRITSSNKPCPMCQTSGFMSMPEKQLQRKILDLKVSCTELKQGCTWTGEIRDLDNHLNKSCSYVTVACPLDCGVTLQRIHLEKHQEDECPQRSTELKLLSLTRKLEERLISVEKKCEEQEEKIRNLGEELTKVKGEKEEQDAMLQRLQESQKETSSVQESTLTQTMKDVESELIKRCVSLPVRVTTVQSLWVSPPFYSHPRGYVLQLTAKLTKFSTTLDSLHSLFSSGRNPEKGPIKLSLKVLPQNNFDSLHWPVYVTVDLFVLSTTDGESSGKIYSLTKYKDLKEDPQLETADKPNQEVIGYARYAFSCRIVILNIRFDSEPPLLEQDTRSAADGDRL